MIRMLIIGYCMGVRSERRLCEEVHLNFAYRWFCRLGLEGDVPDHSTFSKNRHGRFRDSDLLRELFEATVARCIAEGLVGGEGFATDASLIKADANKQRSADRKEDVDLEAMATTRRSVRESLDMLDDAAWRGQRGEAEVRVEVRPGRAMDRRSQAPCLHRLAGFTMAHIRRRWNIGLALSSHTAGGALDFRAAKRTEAGLEAKYEPAPELRAFKERPPAEARALGLRAQADVDFVPSVGLLHSSHCELTTIGAILLGHEAKGARALMSRFEDVCWHEAGHAIIAGLHGLAARETVVRRTERDDDWVGFNRLSGHPGTMFVVAAAGVAGELMRLNSDLSKVHNAAFVRALNGAREDQYQHAEKSQQAGNKLSFSETIEQFCWPALAKNRQKLVAMADELMTTQRVGPLARCDHARSANQRRLA